MILVCEGEMHGSSPGTASAIFESSGPQPLQHTLQAACSGAFLGPCKVCNVTGTPHIHHTLAPSCCAKMQDPQMQLRTLQFAKPDVDRAEHTSFLQVAGLPGSERTPGCAVAKMKNGRAAAGNCSMLP